MRTCLPTTDGRINQNNLSGQQVKVVAGATLPTRNVNAISLVDADRVILRESGPHASAFLAQLQDAANCKANAGRKPLDSERAGPPIFS